MAKTIIGIVSSKKTDKTIVVTEHVRLTHPLYRKQYTVTKKFMAHDEKNEAQEGDRVIIGETRPLSARKHHQLVRVLEKAGVQHVEPEVVIAAKEDSKTEEKA
ncbi:MAG TPA: 30S ribosomal protein S17 [Bacillota bacterium]|nr:30S ribosomal protein S17 [Bacillota bacterium]